MQTEEFLLYTLFLFAAVGHIMSALSLKIFPTNRAGKGEREKGRKGEGEKVRRGEGEKGRWGDGEKGRSCSGNTFYLLITT